MEAIQLYLYLFRADLPKAGGQAFQLAGFNLPDTFIDCRTLVLVIQIELGASGKQCHKRAAQQNGSQQANPQGLLLTVQVKALAQGHGGSGFLNEWPW